MVELDPAGTPATNYLGPGATIVHPSSRDITKATYLRWIIDKFKVMRDYDQDSNKEARCIYFDDIYGNVLQRNLVKQ